MPLLVHQHAASWTLPLSEASAVTRLLASSPLDRQRRLQLHMVQIPLLPGVRQATTPERPQASVSALQECIAGRRRVRMPKLPERDPPAGAYPTVCPGCVPQSMRAPLVSLASGKATASREELQRRLCCEASFSAHVRLA